MVSEFMALMDLLSTYSAVNASLLRSDKRKLSPYKRRTFASIFERKIWEKGKEGLFITAGLVILVANFLANERNRDTCQCFPDHNLYNS